MNCIITTQYLYDSTKIINSLDKNGSLYDVDNELSKKIWEINKEYYNKFDLIIVSDTLIYSRVFLENNFTNKLLLVITNKFDWGPNNNFDYKLFYTILKSNIKNNKKLKVVATTNLSLKYFNEVLNESYDIPIINFLYDMNYIENNLIYNNDIFTYNNDGITILCSKEFNFNKELVKIFGKNITIINYDNNISIEILQKSNIIIFSMSNYNYEMLNLFLFYQKEIFIPEYKIFTKYNKYFPDYRKYNYYYDTYIFKNNLKFFNSVSFLKDLVLNMNIKNKNERYVNSFKENKIYYSTALKNIKFLRNIIQIDIKKKNIISGTLFGNNSLYITGLLENIELSKKYLNGWKWRIYYTNLKKEVYELLKKKDIELIKINDISNNRMLNIAYYKCCRYFPFSDPSIDKFIVRDFDVRISDIDKQLVNHWLKSEKSVYFYKTPWLNLIDGGTLGGTGGEILNIEKQIYKFSTQWKIGGQLGMDQDFLNWSYPYYGNIFNKYIQLNDYICYSDMKRHDYQPPKYNKDFGKIIIVHDLPEYEFRMLFDNYLDEVKVNGSLPKDYIIDRNGTAISVYLDKSEESQSILKKIDNEYYNKINKINKKVN